MSDLTPMSYVQSLFKALWRYPSQPSLPVSQSTNALFTSKEFYRRPLPRICVPFSSPEGKQLFREALLDGHMEAYFALAAQLCTQDEPSYCGLATLVMILNAFEMDPGRVWKRPWRWYHESMLKCCLPSDILTEGIVMDKFAEIAHCHGLAVQMHRVQETDDLTTFRNTVMRLTTNEDEGFLVTSYHRGAVGQTGSGHFAAIGGYHSQRELVFLFDTARFKYPPHWVPITRLWEGMRQIDSVTGQPRGYMILTRSNDLHPSALTRELSGDAPVPQIFGISDSGRQAYLSCAALCDTFSVGYRLRQVADNWTEWLNGELPEPMSTDSALVTEATHCIIDACARHAPRNFFFTVQSSEKQYPLTRESQHQIVRDLLTCPVGQAVTPVVHNLPKDLFKWFTSDGTFCLAIGRSYSVPSISDAGSYHASCPFAELFDPGLRLSLFITCLLCSFPYDQILKQRTLPGDSTRCHKMANLLSSISFTESTQLELQIIRNSFISLLASSINPDEAFDLCCGKKKTGGHKN